MSKQPEGKKSLDIIKLIKSQGGYAWKVHGNEFTPAGTPDVVGVYLGQFIACETKMVGNKLSEIQKYRVTRFREAGGLVVAPCMSLDEAKQFLEYVQRHLTRQDANASIYVRQHYGIEAVFPR